MREINIKAFNESVGGLTGYDCDICKNKGHMLIKDENGYELSRECECMKIRNNLIRIRKSGMENAFLRYSFDNFLTKEDWQRKIKTTALKYTESEHDWFYIGGCIGSGKSHICTAICHEFIMKNNIYFMPWRDEIVKIKASVNNPYDYNELTKRIKNAQILYIDDFLKGRVTEADLNFAFEIINYRYAERRRTIISSEHTIENLTLMDEAIGSRIYEMSKNFICELTGDKNMRFS